MPQWATKIDDAPWERVIEAQHVGIEYGALVFRDAPGGNVLASYAPGHWKSVDQQITREAVVDLFGQATREIVQG
ncbi:MAG TPA: hypothetical protein VGM38_09265 [Pseudolysinimonas sp.]|jgi:hypothetical protein